MKLLTADDAATYWSRTYWDRGTYVLVSVSGYGYHGVYLSVCRVPSGSYHDGSGSLGPNPTATSNNQRWLEWLDIEPERGFSQRMYRTGLDPGPTREALNADPEAFLSVLETTEVL